jgi:hypothetical protein
VWSSDSSRLAYVEYGRVVVRDLHGTRRHRAVGDPTIRDFDRSVDELVSPTGDLVARRGPDGTIVSRPDGSDQRVIKDGWTAGWSPDGRKLLFWEDVLGWKSRLRAVSVDPPFASETVVDHGPINGARSRLPGYGDVSWQPIPDHRRVADTRSATASGCTQLGELKRLFPAARAVGFAGRSGIKYQEARSSASPGRCGGFWTTYTLSNGEGMDVGIDLYKTARDAGRALAEPAASGVHVLPNGARVRYSGPDPGSVDGTPSSSTFVVSAFRRLNISSISISTSMKPVPISEQLRLHRRIENRFARLVAEH